MPVNKGDPRYPRYIEECKALFAEYDAKEEEIEAAYAKRYPNWRGKDNAATVETVPLERERNRKLKDLQRKYGFLSE